MVRRKGACSAVQANNARDGWPGSHIKVDHVSQGTSKWELEIPIELHSKGDHSYSFSQNL